MTPVWTAASHTCPCCTRRPAYMGFNWRQLCDGCLWYAAHLASCPHQLTAKETA